MLRTWLKFTRFGLAGTAVSNALLGAGLAAPWQELDPLHGTLLLIFAVAAYGFGMGLNDFVDRERDRTLHPERPLPSGRLSSRQATMGLGWLLVVAVASLALVGLMASIGGAATLAFIFAYNYLGKHHSILGPLTMGAVRASLVITGAVATASDAPLSEQVLMGAGMVGLFVTALTFLSCEEEKKRPLVLNQRAVYIRVVLLLGASACAVRCTETLGVVVGWVSVWIWVDRHALPPLREQPPRPGQTTFRLLQALFLLDLAILLSYDQPAPAALSFVLWLVARRL